MYERVLLTTDGSVLSRAAVEHASRLVDRARGEAVVLAVSEPLPQFPAQAATVDPAAPRHPGLTDEMAAEFTAAARADAEALRAALGAAGVAQVSIDVSVGLPGETIVARARDLACDAVVMATHGRSGLARTLLGSVADHVVSHLRDVPVVLIRPTEDQEAVLAAPAWAATTASAVAAHARYRHVLVGLDGSPFALRVLPFAVRACDDATGRIELVEVIDALPHAVRGHADEDGGGGESETGLAEREATAAYDRARDSLAAARERAMALGARAVDTAICGGVPEHALVDYVRTRGVDLVAMTTHGRSGGARSLLGSVPNAALRRLAGTPLLLLRPGG